MKKVKLIIVLAGAIAGTVIGIIVAKSTGSWDSVYTGAIGGTAVGWIITVITD